MAQEGSSWLKNWATQGMALAVTNMYTLPYFSVFYMGLFVNGLVDK